MKFYSQIIWSEGFLNESINLAEYQVLVLVDCFISIGSQVWYLDEHFFLFLLVGDAF